jgi:hypothetical protein
METCEFQSSCFVYSNLMKNRPRTLEYIKEEYCDSNYSTCARFMIFKSKGPYKVSNYLFPEDIQEACKILDDLN